MTFVKHFEENVFWPRPLVIVLRPPSNGIKSHAAEDISLNFDPFELKIGQSVYLTKFYGTSVGFFSLATVAMVTAKKTFFLVTMATVAKEQNSHTHCIELY